MADEINQGNELRRIQNAAMAGRELTPAQQALLEALLPEKIARSERIGVPMAEFTGVPQGVRTVGAVSDLVQDPSLANATNAGMNAALLVGRPLSAAGILAGGYGVAGARDAGMLDMSAQAQQRGQKPPAPQLEGLTPQQNQELFNLQTKAQNWGFKSGDDRRLGLKRIDELRAIANANATANNTSKTAEYNNMVKAAETARDAELGRDKRFSETEMGKIWDKTGGTAPLLTGVATGALTRALMKGGGSGFMKEYAVPGTIGALEGAALSNLPLVYNSNYTEPDNPKRLAYEAYARELPPSHPRKAEYAAYAQGLPEKNPVQKVASQELYDPWKAAERMGFGALEGMIGSVVGGKVGGGMRQGAEALTDALMKPFSRTTKTGASSAPPQSELSALRDELSQLTKSLETRPQGTTPAPLQLSPPSTSMQSAAASAPAPTAAIPGPQSAISSNRQSLADALMGKDTGDVLKKLEQPKVKAGAHPDHNWNEAAGRWQDASGQFIAGAPPKK